MTYAHAGRAERRLPFLQASISHKTLNQSSFIPKARLFFYSHITEAHHSQLFTSQVISISTLS